MDQITAYQHIRDVEEAKFNRAFARNLQAVLIEESFGDPDDFAVNEGCFKFFAGLYEMTKPGLEREMLRDLFIRPYMLIQKDLKVIKADVEDPAEQARALINLFEEYCKSPVLKELDKTPPVTCKGSGCSHCCYILAKILPEEAALLVKEADKRGIELDRELLKRQGYAEMTPLGWLAKGPKIAKCVFLIDNKCSVYDVRPLTCRVHQSTEEPDLCNPFRNWRTPLGYANSGKKQLFMSAVASIFGEHQPLPVLVKESLKEMGKY